MISSFRLKFRLDNISLIKPAMRQVGTRRDKLQNFFLHSHIEKKIPKEALVCLEKIIAVIAF